TTGTIIVSDAPVTATASVTLQPNCSISTGTITVSSVLTGHFYSIDGLDYSNTDGIFSGLAPGSYNVTARNASGCVSSPTSVVVNPVALRTWTGALSTDWSTAGNWSPSGIPSLSDCVVIADVSNKPVILGNSNAS